MNRLRFGTTAGRAGGCLGDLSAPNTGGATCGLIPEVLVLLVCVLALSPSDVAGQFQTRETADLFLALVIHLLKDGGKGAIVLPDGSLFGEGVKTRLKERLLETCNLHTSVRLPNGVFAPYTDINTNLLFFTKGEPTEVGRIDLTTK